MVLDVFSPYLIRKAWFETGFGNGWFVVEYFGSVLLVFVAGFRVVDFWPLYVLCDLPLCDSAGFSYIGWIFTRVC